MKLWNLETGNTNDRKRWHFLIALGSMQIHLLPLRTETVRRIYAIFIMQAYWCCTSADWPPVTSLFCFTVIAFCVSGCNDM